MSALLWLLPIGCAAGILAGLFGIGGGIVTVVVLVALLPELGVPPTRVMHVALASSLAAIVLTAVTSTLAHHRRGAVRWAAVTRLAPGVIAGAVGGGWVAHYIPNRALQILFGVFLLIVAVRMARGVRPPATRALPGAAGLSAAGAAIGALSAWTGIGGGSLTGPFLMRCNVPLREAIATAAAVGFPVAVAGTLGYVIGGWSEPGLPGPRLGYVHLPSALILGVTAMTFAPLGARLTHTLPVARLRVAFAVLLGAAAIKVMVG